MRGDYIDADEARTKYEWVFSPAHGAVLTIAAGKGSRKNATALGYAMAKLDP